MGIGDEEVKTRKEDKKENRGAPTGTLASQNKKNHENDKVEKNKTWVLFLPLNVAFKHHSLALHSLSTAYIAGHSTAQALH